jgi:bromodomain adjacent to zinc finger domain protein 1B
MPESNIQITADNLMKGLVSGEDGFEYLSKLLVIMLQTLLQDQLAEDYKELSASLSELPINEYTASELVRLCLRHHDVDDNESDNEDDAQTAADDEVPNDIVEQLETSEFYELDAPVKLQILVGLCHRIMASYSVQDFMDEKQQAAAELWKKRIAEQKMQKDLKRDNKKKDGKKKDMEQKQANPVKSMLESMLDHGKPVSAAESVDGSTVGDEAGPDDDDMVSVVKRRRVLAAKAAEEKRKKELEDKLMRDKEYAEMRQLREKESAEKAFKEGITIAKRAMRHTPLGLDRNHDRYWFFFSAAPGIYIEKGWACDDINYTVCTKASVSLSASESDSETEDLDKKNLNKTLPHTGQNLWFVLDSLTDIQNVCENLHALGVRESCLKEQLMKNMDTIVKTLTKASRAAAEPEVKHEADFMVEGTRQELQDLETRLRHGGLGGVPNYELWDKQLAAAVTVKDFADCLLETQAHVLERFVTGMMAKDGNDKKKDPKSGTDEKSTNEESNDEDDAGTDTDESDKPGVDGKIQWLEAVSQCSTLSRLNVLTGILESCVKWEKSAENAKCKICRKKGVEDHLLLCDECNQPFHLYCLRPALFEVPSGEWFCPACSPERNPRRNRTVVQRKWEPDDDTDEDGDISEDLEHERVCTMCGEEGELVECSTCPSSFHLDCHDPPLRHIPRQNTWKCIQCKTGIRLNRSSRRIKDNKTRKRPKYCEDDDETTDDNYHPTKKLTRTSSASRTKRASDVELVISRSHTKTSAHDTSQCYDSDFKGRDSLGRSSRSRASKENRCTDEDKQAILSVIDKLNKHRQSWPFTEPVDPAEVPDYHSIVKKPMDLKTMEDNCISDLYTSPQKFIDDFALMMNNAVLYNMEDTPVYKSVDPFEKYFTTLVERYFPRCTYHRRR